jgi:hypothetical protein
MDDLARWLTAQLDEDTRTASSWHTLDCDIHAHLEGDTDSVQATMAMFHEAPGLVCDCGGPARMLREIDTKRRVLARHTPHVSGSTDCTMRCERAHPGALVCNHDAYRWPCPDIRDLADAYAHRPGYLEDWRP